MRQVIHKRLQALGLTTENVITQDALDLLVKMSGGVMRQLIRLVREAILEAEINAQQQIDLLTARRAVHRVQRGYAISLGRIERQELKEFLDIRERSGTEVGDILILNGYILNYINDRVWYELNPVVHPLL